MDKKEKVLLIALLVFGLFLRIWRLRELMGFDYDQEVAAFAIDRILAGNLTLIGQEVSIGGAFIGPGFYYLLSIFYWLFAGDPIGAGVMVVCLSLITMTILFFLVKRLVNIPTAFIALLLYVTSENIIFNDRTTAPSNLIMLFSLATVYLLTQIKISGTKYIPLLTFLISFAIIHIHPTTIVLIPISIFTWLYWKLPKPSKKQLLLSGMAALINLSPLIIFDLRHEFINFKGIISSMNVQGEEAYFFPLKFLLLVRVLFNNFSKLLPLGVFTQFVAFLFLLIFVIYSDKNIRKILFAWILIPALFFSFYTRHVTEYYLLVSLPAMLILSACGLYILSRFIPKVAWMLIIVLTIGANIIKVKKFMNPYGLFYRQQTVEYINTVGGKKARVSFDTDHGLEYGFYYLLSKQNIKLANSTNPSTHTIVMPANRRISIAQEKTFGGIKIIENIKNK